MTTTAEPPPGGPADTVKPPGLVGSDGSGSADPGQAGSAGLLAAALAQVRAALAEVAEVPSFTLTPAQVRRLVTEAEAARSAVEELEARLVGEVEAQQLAADAGCASTTAWLQDAARLPAATAGRISGMARAVGTARCAATRVAWAAGRLNADQARVIAEAIRRLSPEVDAERVAAAQADLVARARELSFEELRVVANHLVEVLDPDTADAVLGDRLAAQERDALRHTVLTFRRRGDGSTGFSGRLPDLQVDMLKKAVEAFAAPRRASARDGGQPIAAESGYAASPVLNPDGDHSGTEVGPLTHQQRLGRALAELIEHLPLAAGGVAATVVVTMTLDQLRSGLGTAVLDTGTEITVGEARRLACSAALVPMVLAGESRVLDLGMGQRLFDRHQRLALARRDQGCVWPGCDRPPAWCEAHHLKPWSAGGPTDLTNGALVCGFHHRLLHRGEWTARMAPDGIVEIIPPEGIDPHRTPLRHTRFKHRQPC